MTQSPKSGDRARVILHARPDQFLLAGRAAARCLRPGYEWPSDGLTFIQFGDDHREPSFAVKRNKTGVTVYAPDHAPNPSGAA